MLVGYNPTFSVTPSSAQVYMNSFQDQIEGYYCNCALEYFETTGNNVTVYFCPNTKYDDMKWNITLRLMKIS